VAGDQLGPALQAAFDLILADLRATDAIVPSLRVDDWAGPGAESAMAWWPDGSGVGIGVRLDATPAEQAVELADVLQDAEVEELNRLGRPATWPECPDHPDSHPLQPVDRGGQAVWVCPAADRTIFAIGSVPDAGRSH
jgi:hypothetical protein